MSTVRFNTGRKCRLNRFLRRLAFSLLCPDSAKNIQTSIAFIAIPSEKPECLWNLHGTR